MQQLAVNSFGSCWLDEAIGQQEIGTKGRICTPKPILAASGIGAEDYGLMAGSWEAIWAFIR